MEGELLARPLRWRRHITDRECHNGAVAQYEDEMPGRSAAMPLVVSKVFNNNVVLASFGEGPERVVMGRGIGFQKQPGNVLDIALVEKTYVLDSGIDQSQIESFLAKLPYETVVAVTQAVSDVEAQLGRSLGKSLPVALLDHVSFVLERMGNGVVLPRVVMPELSVMYPDEFAAAKVMQEVLERSLGVELPADESVYLAMHILNATRDGQDQTAGLLFRRVQHVISIVQTFLGVHLDENSLDYARFVLHVKFFMQRLASHSQLEKADSSFFDFARTNYPRSYQCAKQVEAYVQAESGILLTNEEMLYLIVHIERVASVSAEREGKKKE